MIPPAPAPPGNRSTAGESPAPDDDSAAEPPDPWPTDPEARRARQQAVEELGEDIARLSAHLEAGAYRLLVMIRECDHWRGWHRDGATSCAQWLAWRTGITPGAARERVRVARALAELPALSEALSRGELSYSVARVLTRVATPENEAELVELARRVPAGQVARLVRRWRVSQKAAAELAAEEEARHQGRELWLTPAAGGGWRIHGRLDPEAGAVLRKALEAAEEELYRTRTEEGTEEAEAEAPVPRRRRWADALGLVAERALAAGFSGEDAPVSGTRAERYQVFLHVDKDTLEDRDGESEPGRSELGSGTRVSPESSRRLACDAAVVPVLRGPEGGVLDVTL